jgi:hypothetical protein
VPEAKGRFFVNFQKGKYTRQPAGKGKIAGLSREIATSIGLTNPKEYTGHALRVTSATILADAGVSMTNLKRHGGWKSDTVVEGYLRESKKLKSDNAALISGSIHKQTLAFSATQGGTSTTAQSPTITTEVEFTNSTFHNCTFYVSDNKN